VLEGGVQHEDAVLDREVDVAEMDRLAGVLSSPSSACSSAPFAFRRSASSSATARRSAAFLRREPPTRPSFHRQLADVDDAEPAAQKHGAGMPPLPTAPIGLRN
jgi:hypothetical protein